MSWIVDRYEWVLLFLGVAAAGFGYLWYDTRKPRYLLGTGAFVLAMMVVAGLTFLVETDNQRLARNVDEMRDAINAGKVEEAMKHFDNKIKIKTASGVSEIDKAQLLQFARGNMSRYAVKKVITGPVHVDKLDNG